MSCLEKASFLQSLWFLGPDISTLGRICLTCQINTHKCHIPPRGTPPFTLKYTMLHPGVHQTRSTLRYTTPHPGVHHTRSTLGYTKYSPPWGTPPSTLVYTMLHPGVHQTPSTQGYITTSHSHCPSTLSLATGQSA